MFLVSFLIFFNIAWSSTFYSSDTLSSYDIPSSSFAQLPLWYVNCGTIGTVCELYPESALTSFLTMRLFSSRKTYSSLDISSSFTSYSLSLLYSLRSLCYPSSKPFTREKLKISEPSLGLFPIRTDTLLILESKLSPLMMLIVLIFILIILFHR